METYRDLKAQKTRYVSMSGDAGEEEGGKMVPRVWWVQRVRRVY
jgi:hypothetical protein